MRDIVSRGSDQEPGPWRRRGPRLLAAAAAVALAAFLIAVHLPHTGAHTRHTGAAASAPAPLNSAFPAQGLGSLGAVTVGVTGQPWGSGTRLPLAAKQPAWLWPGTGRAVPIGGLPPEDSRYQFLRLVGGWAIQGGPAIPMPGCSGCAGEPLPVYFAGDQARSATRVGLATQVAPGAGPGQLWLTSYLPSANPNQAAGTAQEVSVTGEPLGPQVTLPAGQVIVRATDRGLLLAPPVAWPGTANYILWDPARPQARRNLGHDVIAASATEVARAPRCNPACQVQVLDLATGGSMSVTLPAASSAASASFSPDGQFLAIEVIFLETADNGDQAAQLDVASVATGRVSVAPGSWVSSDALVGFGWPAGGDSLTAELSFTTKVQVTSWVPGAARVAVATLRPGPDSALLVLG